MTTTHTQPAGCDLDSLTRYDHRGALMVPDQSGDYFLVGDVREAAARAAQAPQGDARQGAGIYVASRASVPARPQMWRRLRANGWPIISTWIDEAGEGETGDFGELWKRIEAEIATARGVILYAEESDFPLKGAFIECGMALGMSKPVAVVLKFPLLDRSMKPLGSWANHPLVKICHSLDQARRYVESFAPAAHTCTPADERAETWLPIETAPKDGTMLRLLVQFEANATEDSDGPCATIGANNFDHDGEDVWKFAGWNWCHDEFTEGVGTPVGWLPMLDRAAQGAGTAPVDAKRLKDAENALATVNEVLSKALGFEPGVTLRELLWSVEVKLQKATDPASVSTAAASDMVMLPRAVIDSTLDALRKAQMFKSSTALGNAVNAAPAAEVSTAAALATHPAPVSTAAATTASGSETLEQVAEKLEQQHTWITNVAAANIVRSFISPSRAADGQQDASRAALDEIFAAIDEAQRMNHYNESSFQIGIRVARLKCLADEYRAALARNLPAQGAAQVEVARDEMTQAARDVLAERQRQQEIWTEAGDDRYTNGELSYAACSYAVESGHLLSGMLPDASREPPFAWPWDKKWWKSGSVRRNLIKAGALILAEIERIDRATLAAKRGCA